MPCIIATAHAIHDCMASLKADMARLLESHNHVITRQSITLYWTRSMNELYMLRILQPILLVLVDLVGLLSSPILAVHICILVPRPRS